VPTIIKGKNTNVKSEATHGRASKEAAEHFRQIVSRQHRALKRSTPETAPRHSRSYLSRKQPPLTKSTRVTTVGFARNLRRLGTSKVIKRSIHTQVVPQHRNVVGRGKGGLQVGLRPRTPTQSSSDPSSDSEEDASPNITPASLRSASKRSTHTSPTMEGLVKNGRPRKANSEHERLSKAHDISKSDFQQDEDVTATKATYMSEDGVEKSYHPAQSRSRSTRGR
jgi:palmitoyltransferase ZDHHC9/14/18